MNDFLVIVHGTDSETGTQIKCLKFFDNFIVASQFKQDCECGLGYMAEVYTLNEQGNYELLFS